MTFCSIDSQREEPISTELVQSSNLLKWLVFSGVSSWFNVKYVDKMNAWLLGKDRL